MVLKPNYPLRNLICDNLVLGGEILGSTSATMGSPVTFDDMKKLLGDTTDTKLNLKLEKIETDINDLKEQALAQRYAIARLEMSASSNAPTKTEAEHSNDTNS